MAEATGGVKGVELLENTCDLKTHLQPFGPQDIYRGKRQSKNSEVKNCSLQSNVREKDGIEP